MMNTESTMNTPALVANGIGMRFGSKQVLAGLDLEVRRGEILAVLGANGAGKTTLLSILTGLRRPGQGQVRVFGEDPHRREARSGFGVMLQDCELPLMCGPLQMQVTDAAIVAWAFGELRRKRFDDELGAGLAWEALYAAVEKTLARTQVKCCL